MTSELSNILLRFNFKFLLMHKFCGIFSNQLLFECAIAKNNPLFSWNNYLEFQTSSETWLIKAWEPSITEKWLKMCVKVNLVILRILESVQACRICHICIDESNFDSVLLTYF